MRRRWVIAGVGLAISGIAVAVAVQQLTRTDHRTTARSVTDVLDDFRRGTELPAGSTVLPEPGVYVYRTSGSDGIDALGGAEHTYPSSTTITVRVAGCGVTSRWDVAAERWDETTSCETDGGVVRTTFVAFHRFFGTDVTERERCTGEPRPPGGDEGTTWAFECVEGDSRTPWLGTILGDATIDVAGRSIPTDHVLLTTPGDPDGDVMRIETWYAAGTDLIVREVGSRRTANPSMIGDVDYREDYEIALTELEPLH